MRVFNLSSGYSGTAYACALLARSPTCLAEHEAPPTLFGPWTALWNETSGEPTPELVDPVRHKLEAAENRRKGAGKAHYADTSHGFVKGWGPVAIKAGLITPHDSRLIATRRAPAKVVRAMVALRMIPGGASFPCDHYWLDPHALRNHITLSSDSVHAVLAALKPVCSDGMFAMQLIQTAWYVLEIEARIDAFRAEYPEFPLFTLDLECLCTAQLDAFYDHCGVPSAEERLVPPPVNAKQYLYEVPLAWAEHALEALRGTLETTRRTGTHA